MLWLVGSEHFARFNDLWLDVEIGPRGLRLELRDLRAQVSARSSIAFAGRRRFDEEELWRSIRARLAEIVSERYAFEARWHAWRWREVVDSGTHVAAYVPLVPEPFPENLIELTTICFCPGLIKEIGFAEHRCDIVVDNPCLILFDEALDAQRIHVHLNLSALRSPGPTLRNVWILRRLLLIASQLASAVGIDVRRLRYENSAVVSLRHRPTDLRYRYLIVLTSEAGEDLQQLERDLMRIAERSPVNHPSSTSGLRRLLA